MAKIGICLLTQLPFLRAGFACTLPFSRLQTHPLIFIRVRLAQLTNKCNNEDLDFFVREAGDILGVSDKARRKNDSKAILAHILEELVKQFQLITIKHPSFKRGGRGTSMQNSPNFDVILESLHFALFRLQQSGELDSNILSPVFSFLSWSQESNRSTNLNFYQTRLSSKSSIKGDDEMTVCESIAPHTLFLLSVFQILQSLIVRERGFAGCDSHKYAKAALPNCTKKISARKQCMD